MRVSILFLLAILFTFSACDQAQNTKPQGTDQPAVSLPPSHPFTLPMEKGHSSDEFIKHEVFRFDLDLDFRGQDRMDATISLRTNSSGIRIDKKDGSSLVFDGSKVFLSPAEADEKGARFDMFTWQYFFALPYKLNDPGTRWEDLGLVRLTDSLELPAGKLSFEGETGDAPDDWYAVFYDPTNGLIHTAGYIVTFGGRDPEKARENAHAISYHNYEIVDGIPIATEWSFHNWSLEGGLGEEIGQARLSNLSFSDTSKELFGKPQNSKEIRMQ